MAILSVWSLVFSELSIMREPTFTMRPPRIELSTRVERSDVTAERRLERGLEVVEVGGRERLGRGDLARDLALGGSEQRGIGLIWVVATPDPDGGTALDAQAHLGDLDAEFGGYGLAGYHHYETRVIRRKMNWKLVIDTFLEPYHLGVLHRNTVAPLFHANVCLFDAFGPHLREVLPRASVTEQRRLPEHEWDFIAHNTIVYVLFPNTVFVMQVDHAETWRVFPVDGRVDECEMYLDFFVPNPIDSDSARRHWERNMDLTIRTVCDEDFPVSETMQRNFTLGSRSHAIFGRNEPALAHFESTVLARTAAQARAPAG